MSDRIPYDPALFALDRAEVVSARLGEFIVGVSRLGVDTSAWLPIPTATFTMSEGYTVDVNGTLIYDSETASVSLSHWGDAGDILRPLDRVRALYDGGLIFLGTVDTTNVAYVVDPDALNHGATRRVVVSASLLGTYAAALGGQVCWAALPEESPIVRIRRWLTVEGWD